MIPAPSEIDPSISYADLAAAYDRYTGPWESVAQCNAFERAARLLLRRDPVEAEKDGVRFRKRDGIRDDLEDCKRARGALQLCARGDTVIVPPDQLR